MYIYIYIYRYYITLYIYICILENTIIASVNEMTTLKTSSVI